MFPTVPGARRPRDPGRASRCARRPPSGHGPAAAAGNGRRAAGGRLKKGWDSPLVNIQKAIENGH